VKGDCESPSHFEREAKKGQHPGYREGHLKRLAQA
jgi:hypothetical protein